MVFYCPECRSTLLHNEGSTIKIDNMEIVNLKKNQIIRFVQGLKEQFVNQDKKCIPATPQVSCLTAESDGAGFSQDNGRPFRKVPISRDDILNLRIDLESTLDVSDFLSRIA
jgi:hypothetical protein